MNDKHPTRNYLVAIALLSMPQFLFGQAANPSPKTEKHTATSSLELKQVDGKKHTIIDNQRFTIVYTCQASGCFDLVLHEDFFSDTEDEVEGGRSVVNVSAWQRDKPDAILWKARLHADVGKAHENFYETTLYGCCGDPDQKKILVFTDWQAGVRVA